MDKHVPKSVIVRYEQMARDLGYSESIVQKMSMAESEDRLISLLREGRNERARFEEVLAR